MTDPQDITSDTTAQSSRTLFPARLRSLDRWMTWKEDEGRKIPRAPQNGGPELFASAMDEDNWMAFDRASDYVEMVESLTGLTFTTTSDDGLCLLDYDDVRNPVTGEVLPVVKEHIEQVGGYAQVSTSGTGVHLIVEGDLPGDLRSMTIDLDGHPDAELEVYPGDRFIAMTGEVLDCSDSTIRDGQELLDGLVDEYGEEATTMEDGERGAEWEPDTDREEIESMDESSNIEDIYDAIKHTTVRDIRLKSERTEGEPGGRMSFDPSWEHSDSGTRLGYEDGAWIYRKGNIGLDALQVVALEERIIHSPDQYPSGGEFWEAVEALRDRGAPIPEYEGGGRDADVVAILPTTPNGGEWNWQGATNTISSEDMPSQSDARERLSDRMEEVWENGEDVLLSALPGLGKSSGAVRSAARTGEQTTIYTARHDLYGQYRGWCQDHNLSYYTLPSMPRDCPTASGEFGDEWQERVMDWYKRGATPKAIHAHAENALGHPLPCQEEGQCPYSAKWDFDPDEFDVLIGHYKHAYKENTHAGRMTVFDEFPEDTYVTAMGGPQFKGAVTRYLQEQDDIPADDFAELIARRDDPDFAETVKDHFDGEIDTDPESVVYNEDAHANAPIAVYALVDADDLGNGYEACRLPGGDRAVIERGNLTVWTLHTPDLTYTSGVVALDGTPTEEMWRIALDKRLSEEHPLDEEERRHYLANGKGINVVKTTDAIKPYSSGKYVTEGGVKQDKALLEGIEQAYGESPALITTLNALNKYENAGVLEHTSAEEHYGNLKGSNRFASTRLGAIVGSRHYGDSYIKRWGAFRNNAIEANGERGDERSYGPFGDEILTHMREHETLQALLRFGRDGGGATVFVHTDTLPEWVPLAGRGATVKVWSEGMGEVIDAVKNESEWRTTEVAERCSISRRQVLSHLNTLADIGYVEQSETTNGFVWADAGLDTAGEAGHVEFSDIDIDALGDDTVDEVARSVIFTWDFAPLGSDTAHEEQVSANRAVADGGAPETDASDEGDPPE